jgi:hypothetical protein
MWEQALKIEEAASQFQHASCPDLIRASIFFAKLFQQDGLPGQGPAVTASLVACGHGIS